MVRLNLKVQEPGLRKIKQAVSLAKTITCVKCMFRIDTHSFIIIFISAADPLKNFGEETGGQKT